MTKYKVTISLVVNPSRDSGLDQPETTNEEFTVIAENEKEAIEKAKELETSHLSVWESWADEIE